MTSDLSKGLDWWLTHSVTLALDVPKTGTIGSGELENRQRSVGISAFLLLSGPIRKRIQYLLVLNIRIGRTNRPPRISLLRNKTLQSNRLSQGRHILGAQVMLLKIRSSSNPWSKREQYPFQNIYNRFLSSDRRSNVTRLLSTWLQSFSVGKDCTRAPSTSNRPWTIDREESFWAST